MNTYRLTMGDLAQSMQLRGNQTRLKEAVTQLSTELTTGRRATLDPRLGGDVAPLAALERSRSAIAPWQGMATEAQIAADAVQNALGHMAATTQGFATDALAAAGLGNDADVTRASGQAAEVFAQVVGTLNGAVAGRSLFAGTATDSRALIDGADILARVAAASAAAGAVSAADHAAAVEAYFAPGGGFETAAYLGGDAPELRIGPAETVAGLPTAADPDLRETLAGLALAAIAADTGLGVPAAIRKEMVADAGNRVLSGSAALVDLQAGLGHVQERIETSLTRLDSEAAALDMAIAELTVADPFATAAKLEATQVQLETLYAVTARLSSMGLAGYLR